MTFSSRKACVDWPYTSTLSFDSVAAICQWARSNVEAGHGRRTTIPTSMKLCDGDTLSVGASVQTGSILDVLVMLVNAELPLFAYGESLSYRRWKKSKQAGSAFHLVHLPDSSRYQPPKTLFFLARTPGLNSTSVTLFFLGRFVWLA